MTSTWADDALSRNAFLGGRLQVLQPRRGYRAGTDPVLLAAAVDASPGDSVLELGCGAGVALLCLGARQPGLRLTGVELQPAYADLARRNAALNRQPIEVVEADLAALPGTIKARRFDHVISNPPYFDRAHSLPAPDPGRELAFGGAALSLTDWIITAARRVAPGGRLTLIQRSDRLPEMMAAVAGRLGSIVVLPLAARQGRAADRVLLQARAAGRAAFRLGAPLVLHAGDRHLRDTDDFTEAARKILRDGEKLRMDV